MARFAIFYNRFDMSAIAAEATNPGLTPQERQVAQKYWNAGIKDWSSAPLAPADRMDGDPDTRIVIVDGSQVSLQGLIDFLNAVGNKYPGAYYMTAIADDLSRTAVEPWP